MVAFLAIWLVLGFALQKIFEATGGVQSSVFLFLFLLGVAGALYLIYMVHRVLLRTRLASPRLTVLNARPRLGERITFDVKLEARRSVTVEKVVAVLSLREEVREARRGEKILPVVVTRIETTPVEQLQLERGKPVDVAGEITVPVDGMQSFESHHCALRWQLDVLIYAGRHLACRLREPLSVQPVQLKGEGAER